MAHSLTETVNVWLMAGRPDATSTSHMINASGRWRPTFISSLRYGSDDKQLFFS